MGRVYTVEFEGVAVTAQVDFFEISPADDKPIAVHGILLGQSSDVGDAAEELLRIRVIRGHTTSGSGGAAPTPVPLDPGDAAAGFTAETCNTTIASSGTTTNVYSPPPFNVRTGMEMWFPPEDRPKASQANTTLVVRLMAAPADSLTMSGTLVVEEL
jgi:hypothetical protein